MLTRLGFRASVCLLFMQKYLHLMASQETKQKVWHNPSRRTDDSPGSDLFLVRLSRTGLAASKPCDACLVTLQTFGVHKVDFFPCEGNGLGVLQHERRDSC